MNDLIKNLIKANGPLTVADFMNEALFHPQYGYYRVARPIGKAGDFITAPEISQVFGELIAAYFLNFILASSKKIALVEMGAGRGTLFKDLLVTIEKLSLKLGKSDEIKACVNFCIIEISESLTKIQQEKLGENVKWYQNFGNFLKDNSEREIYFISNELFDCFPIHQFLKTSQGWCERMIGLVDDELAFVAQNFNAAKHNLISEICAQDNMQNCQEGDIFEHSFAALNFMEELAQALENQGGMALIIDYGYTKSPLKSTLQALKNHQYSDVLKDVASSDITALVDFTALQNCAKKNHLASSLVTQREFLLALGIEERRKILKDDEALNRLIAADQMGELFKCLIVWKG